VGLNGFGSCCSVFWKCDLRKTYSSSEFQPDCPIIDRKWATTHLTADAVIANLYISQMGVTQTDHSEADDGCWQAT